MGVQRTFVDVDFRNHEDNELFGCRRRALSDSLLAYAALRRDEEEEAEEDCHPRAHSDDLLTTDSERVCELSDCELSECDAITIWSDTTSEHSSIVPDKSDSDISFSRPYS